MLVHRGNVCWAIGAIATLLLTRGSSYASTKLREPRRWPIVGAIRQPLEHARNYAISSSCARGACGDATRRDLDDFKPQPDERFAPKRNARHASELIRANPAGDYLSRRNASDYYAQRRAVMERYYARQREINARYANQVDRDDVTLFRLNREYPSENSTARRGASTSNDETRSSGSSRTRDGSDNESPSVPNRLAAPTSCPNATLSGTFAPKTRPKQTKNCTGETSEKSNAELDHALTAQQTSEENVGDDRQRWGECRGKIVYQHNLLLGLRGVPSNLDTLFEVIIQGPVCITCVETLRYNNTRALVSLHSGGRGHEYAKFRLTGYPNEGFSYIIKVWGVRRTGAECENAD